jgi:hypothetical protein
MVAIKKEDWELLRTTHPEIIPEIQAFVHSLYEETKKQQEEVKQ